MLNKLNNSTPSSNYLSPPLFGSDPIIQNLSSEIKALKPAVENSISIGIFHKNSISKLGLLGYIILTRNDFNNSKKFSSKFFDEILVQFVAKNYVNPVSLQGMYSENNFPPT